MPRLNKLKPKGWTNRRPDDPKRHAMAARGQKSTGSMFYDTPHYQYLGKTVRMDTPENAKKSTKKLESEFKKAKTFQKKVRILRATILAKNRADAQLKRKKLSVSERSEFKQISKIYGDSAKRMKSKGF